MRRAVMAARVMLVEGDLQRSKDGVIHVMARQITDRSDVLASLSNMDRLEPKLSRADIFAHPEHPHEAMRHLVQQHGHPRNLRLLPKSRDFH